MPRNDQAFWRQDEPEERAATAFAFCEGLVKRFREHQKSRERRNIELYEGDDSLVLGPGASATNVVQSIVDSFVGDMSQRRVKLQFLTHGGSWEEREAAQAMGLAVEAIFEDQGLYGEEGLEVCRDGFVCGEGAFKITPDYEGGRVLIERISSADLFVDARDGRRGRPRTLVYATDVALEVLQGQHPDQAEALAEADSPSIDDLDWGESFEANGAPTERVRVREIWHLPSVDVDSSDDAAWGLKGAKPSHDGRHMLLAGPGADGRPIVLVDEPWAIQRFPIVWWTPIRRVKGWRGHSLPERLSKTQEELDKWQDRVSGMMDLHSYTKLYVNTEAGVEVAKISNDYSRVWTGKGPPGNSIATINADAVPPELFRRIDQLTAWPERFSGKTDLTMRGAREPGVESGVAIRNLVDQGAVRHAPQTRRWERLHVEAGYIVVEMLRLLAAANKDFELSWGTDREMKRVKWNELDLDKARWLIRIWPTNLFGSTPQAKLEAIIEIFKSGGLPQEEMSEVLANEFPDIGALMGRQSAARNNVEAKLAKITKEREVTARTMPTKIMNLQLALDRATVLLNQLEADEAPVEVIAAVKEFWSQTNVALGNVTPEPSTVPPEAMTAPEPLPITASAPTMAGGGGFLA